MKDLQLTILSLAQCHDHFSTKLVCNWLTTNKGLQAAFVATIDSAQFSR